MRIRAEIRLCLLITVSARSLEPMNNSCLLSVSLAACLSKGQCPHPTATCPVPPELPRYTRIVYTRSIINGNREEIESESNERDASNLAVSDTHNKHNSDGSTWWWWGAGGGGVCL